MIKLTKDEKDFLISLEDDIILSAELELIEDPGNRAPEGIDSKQDKYGLEIWDAMKNNKVPDPETLCRYIAISTSEYVYNSDRKADVFYTALKNLLKKGVLKFTGKGMNLKLIYPEEFKGMAWS